MSVNKVSKPSQLSSKTSKNTPMLLLAANTFSNRQLTSPLFIATLLRRYVLHFHTSSPHSLSDRRLSISAHD
jgi:hypothetical protein